MGSSAFGKRANVSSIMSTQGLDPLATTEATVSLISVGLLTKFSEGLCQVVKKIVEGFPGTIEHINAMAQCRIFVGHKTHSVVFALVAGTPLIAIAYHKKTEDFMAAFGLSEYCIPGGQLSGPLLVALFDAVNGNLDAIQEQEEKTGSALCHRVCEDFAGMIKRMRAGLA